MRAALCGAFFLSGASALIFENLWFRQAGLAFGNDVWAQSIVLTAFMGGLALGNALAIRRPALSPVRFYARLEVTVAITGVALVALLPALGAVFAPLFRLLAGHAVSLNGARLALALVLLLIPSTAMGLTLPLLAKALSRSTRVFGENLGALYGWNTLGAVAGAVLVETVLVPSFGMRGAALAAGALNLLAAGIALRLSPVLDDGLPEPGPPGLPLHALRSWDVRRQLAVAFLTGATLLALEVVWFRFLSLFCDSTNLAFALQLAVVLAGIAVGGLAGGRWLGRDPDAARWIGSLLALAGLFLVASYAGFNSLFPLLGHVRFADPLRILACAAFLTLPVSLLSGTVFTLLGHALSRHVGGQTASAGVLTFANTMGAMAGAVAGGFGLLPGLGMERSLVLLACCYGAGFLIVPRPERLPRNPPGLRVAMGAVGLYLVFLAFFPHGLMNAIYIRLPLLLLGKDSKILAVREGLTGTSVYVETRHAGMPTAVRLVTNGFSMSSTLWSARRYMGLYAYLPAALRGDLRHALLVCYGVGTTARALVRLPELQTIDVVDTSADVFTMSSIVHPPGSDPLEDPRVRSHVEDGRNFLALTTNRYDLITSEPPPPSFAGVASLYSQEYFELLRSRLADGGVATYWLPVHAIREAPTRAVIRAFCNAFPDCTLWNGFELDWMLMGTRTGDESLGSPASTLWSNPAVQADLRDIGLDTPERMAALFLADRTGLDRLTGSEPPVTDDWPARMGTPPTSLPTPLTGHFLSTAEPWVAFSANRQMARFFPPMGPSLEHAFQAQRLLDWIAIARVAGKSMPPAWLHEAVAGGHRLAVLQWFGLDPDVVKVARLKEQLGQPLEPVAFELAVSALAEGHLSDARRWAAVAHRSGTRKAAILLAYANVQTGHSGEIDSLEGALSPEDLGFLKSLPAGKAAPVSPRH